MFSSTPLYRKQEIVTFPWHAALFHMFLILTAVFMTLYLRTFVEAEQPLEFGKPLPEHSISLEWPEVDLDKLAIAVSCAETACAKDGTAIHRRNAFGIMCYDDGKRYPCYFPTMQDSFTAFKRIWSNPKGYYQSHLPNLRLATTWVCGPRTPVGQSCGGGIDKPQQWLDTVLRVYATL